MKWEQDLVTDIRFHNKKDDIDDPRIWGYSYEFPIPEEFSQKNRDVLKFLIDWFKPKTFVEIGVSRNKDKSSTKVILDNLKDGIYLGIDIEDKSHLNSDRIHTIKCNSLNHKLVYDKMDEVGISSIDLLLIDGWHSINQVLSDWEYSSRLSKSGVVCFHDTTAHPGPKKFLNHLNADKWNVKVNMCEEDYGFGFCYRKA